MPIIIDYVFEQTGFVAQTILTRCGHLLQDSEHVRWREDELLSWIDEAVTAIINLKPPAGVKDVVLTLMQGARQDLDATVAQLVDIAYNLSADGNTQMRAISRADRSLLDASVPNWPTMKAASQVRHFMFDDRTPHAFYVYPPVLAGTKVRASVSAIPEALESPEDAIPLRANYADSIVNYVCFRALSKDNEEANGATAAAYYQAFQTSMGFEVAGADRTSPNGDRP